MRVSTLLTQGSGSHGQGQEAEASHLRRERPRRGTKLTIVLTCTLLTDANTSVYAQLCFGYLLCNSMSIVEVQPVTSSERWGGVVRI